MNVGKRLSARCHKQIPSERDVRRPHPGLSDDAILDGNFPRGVLARINLQKYAWEYRVPVSDFVDDDTADQRGRPASQHVPETPEPASDSDLDPIAVLLKDEPDVLHVEDLARLQGGLSTRTIYRDLNANLIEGADRRYFEGSSPWTIPKMGFEKFLRRFKKRRR